MFFSLQSIILEGNFVGLAAKSSHLAGLAIWFENGRTADLKINLQIYCNH